VETVIVEGGAVEITRAVAVGGKTRDEGATAMASV
jgi:hypothetical protein